jgi:hypothetical protein
VGNVFHTNRLHGGRDEYGPYGGLFLLHAKT